MPRTARKIVDGGLYHIINRGNAQQTIFRKEQDFQSFADLLANMAQTYQVEIFAWCLMSNHYHLVVKPVNAEQLSKGMHWFQSTHVRRYHRHYGSSGHLWQGRYKSYAIEGDEHFLAVIRYVEANPVRANMVKSAADWTWSSHRHRLGTGSAGDCPNAENEGDSPFMEEGLSPCVKLTALPIELPQPWTDYVDMPMTEAEIFKVRNKV
ncbi:MAG: transposase [Thermodesulfobacteriota bacterium]|nr:transposase [Thermodesulfobacteriota bacterium]